MLPEDQKAWDDYSERARTRLRGESSGVLGKCSCTLQVIVEPAFDNEIAWTLGRATEGPVSWRVVYSVWRKEQDAANFFDPLARLRTSGQPPNIETMDWAVEPHWAEDTVAELRQLAIGLSSNRGRIVLDGTRYELHAELKEPVWQLHWSQVNPDGEDPVLGWVLGTLSRFETLRDE